LPHFFVRTGIIIIIFFTKKIIALILSPLDRTARKKIAKKNVENKKNIASGRGGAPKAGLFAPPPYTRM